MADRQARFSILIGNAMMQSSNAINPQGLQLTNDPSVPWLPFTANRIFKKNSRLVSHAKGMNYYTFEGREVLFGRV
jgi:beta-alanine--pyruvate transaminase